MKKRISEFQCLSALRLAPQTLEQKEVYKACVAVANNGLRLNEENALSPTEKSLLETRRLLQRGSFSLAKLELESLAGQGLEKFHEGDRVFLLSQLMHRQGKQNEAQRMVLQAAETYAGAYDLHRELRARVNAAICTADLNKCLYGELVAFEQEALRLEYYDILGNIARTRAIELLVAAQFAQASQEASKAAAYYERDGYPDDRAIALLVAALGELLQGRRAEALELQKKVLIKEGKVKIYHDVFVSVLQGKSASVPKGHPLAAIPWKTHGIKTNSVPGKILQRLQKGPCTRDELLLEVWGENALQAAYCSRLYTAVNALKKSKGLTILFDGERYHLG